MSWEYLKYEATCQDCGKTGYCIEGSDDWGRHSRDWEGFENQEADGTAVARKRADKREARGLCSCGSSNIEKGKFVE